MGARACSHSPGAWLWESNASRGCSAGTRGTRMEPTSPGLQGCLLHRSPQRVSHSPSSQHPLLPTPTRSFAALLPWPIKAVEKREAFSGCRGVQSREISLLIALSKLLTEFSGPSADEKSTPCTLVSSLPAQRWAQQVESSRGV